MSDLSPAEREWKAVGEQRGAARAGETMWSGPFLAPGERIVVIEKHRLTTAEDRIRVLEAELVEVEKMTTMCGGLSWPKALERLTAVRDRVTAALSTSVGSSDGDCPCGHSWEWHAAGNRCTKCKPVSGSSDAGALDREPCAYCRQKGREWTADCEDNKAGSIDRNDPCNGAPDLMKALQASLGMDAGANSDAGKPVVHVTCGVCRERSAVRLDPGGDGICATCFGDYQRWVGEHHE
jgi:hypothetical protein